MRTAKLRKGSLQFSINRIVALSYLERPVRLATIPSKSLRSLGGRGYSSDKGGTTGQFVTPGDVGCNCISEIDGSWQMST